MFFSRKKKVQRDRNAGLVFHWRGGNTGNGGGLTIALLITTGMFIVGMLGFKVYVEESNPPSRYRAEIIHVDQVDPSLRWLLERNSPHLTPWHNSQNELGLAEVRNKMYEEIDLNRKNQVGWNDIEYTPVELFQNESREEIETVVLPDLVRHSIARSEPEHGGHIISAEELELEWKLVLSSSDKSMIARLPDQKAYVISGDELKDYWGETVYFSVNVNAKGEVLSSLPLKRSNDEEIHALENWLNTVKFKAAKASETKMSLMTVAVSVTSSTVEKKEELK